MLFHRAGPAAEPSTVALGLRTFQPGYPEDARENCPVPPPPGPAPAAKALAAAAAAAAAPCVKGPVLVGLLGRAAAVARARLPEGSGDSMCDRLEGLR